MHCLSFLLLNFLSLINAALATSVRDPPQVRTVVIKEIQPIAYVCNGTTITSTTTNLRTITDAIDNEGCITVPHRPTSTVITSLETSCVTLTTTAGNGRVITITKTTTITHLSTKTLAAGIVTTTLVSDNLETLSGDDSAGQGALTASLSEKTRMTSHTWTSGEAASSFVTSLATTKEALGSSLTAIEKDSTSLASQSPISPSTDILGSAIEAEVIETSSPPSSSVSYSSTEELISFSTSIDAINATSRLTGNSQAPFTTPRSEESSGFTELSTASEVSASSKTEIETETEPMPTPTPTPIVTPAPIVTPTPVETPPITLETTTIGEASPSSETEPETESTPESSTSSERPTIPDDERFVIVTAAQPQGTSSTFTVPAAATAMRFNVQGGCGGDGWIAFAGGRGGLSALITGDIPVSPGQQIAALAGGSGTMFGQGGTGGYGDGGGSVMFPDPGPAPYFCGGGGAGSAVLLDGELLVVSPGGGGGGSANAPSGSLSQDFLSGDASLVEARGQGFTIDGPGPGLASGFRVAVSAGGGWNSAAGSSEPGQGGFAEPLSDDIYSFPDENGYEVFLEDGYPGNGINGGAAWCYTAFCGGAGGGGYRGGGGGAFAGAQAPSGDGTSVQHLFGGGGAGSIFVRQGELDVNVSTGIGALACQPGRVTVEFS